MDFEGLKEVLKEMVSILVAIGAFVGFCKVLSLMGVW